MGIALALGLIIGTRAGVNDTTALSTLLVAILLAIIAIVPRQVRLLLVAGGIGFVVALVTYQFKPDQTAVQPPALGDVHLSAIVGSDPAVRRDGLTARLHWQEAETATRGTAFAFLPSTPIVGRDDRLEVTGRFNESGLLFIETLRIDQKAGRLEQFRRKLRQHISETIHRSVPGSPGTLAVGLLIGDDSGLPEEEEQDVRRAGLSHITAVSGWNVTLVIVSLGAFFAAFALRSWPLLLLQLLAVAGFVWLVGLDPPVVRAALMGIAALIAIQLGRPVHSLTALLLAGALMIVASPATLGSLSFQLSFLSMLGLIGIVTLAGGTSHQVQPVLAPFWATAAAGVATAPLLAMRFGTLSLGTIPANLLVTPAVPLATYGAAIVALTGKLPVVGLTVGWPVWGLCAFILWVARFVSSIPGSYLEFQPLSGSVMAAIYLAILLAALPLFAEGRYLLRSVAEWATDVPAQALGVLAGAVSVLTLVLITL